MDDWQQEWLKKLEKTGFEIERFFLDLGQAAESFTEEMGETIEVFVEQVQEVIVTEVDGFVRDFIDPLIEASNEFEEILWEDLEEYADYPDEFNFTGVGYQKPSAENNPACINCTHYHGHIYHGNLLVCGMHPYGWDDDDCPDWEN
ncbi:MAG: hypothetical protein Tsb0014_35750 [Pleurocapsa sp.]